MDTTIDQQVAMDETLVPHAQRLRIRRRNFCLLSDIKSKESTLQLIYDVLRPCPFFKAFLIIADVPEIYMQEFWATATVHHHAIRFKMDNKKHIINLESFRDMIHICPRVHGQSFTELPFKEEILAFIRFFGHSAAIRTLTDVNINKLYQLWRSFAPIFNKCLTEKSSGYDSLRLSQAQILSNTKILRRAMRCIILGSRRLSSTISCPRLTTSEKGKQAAKAFKAKNKGTGSIPGVLDVPTDESEEELSWNSTDEEGKDGDGDEEDDGDDDKEGDGDDDDDDDEQEVKRDDDKHDEEEGGDDEQEYDEEESDEETRDEESFDPISKTPENSEDKGNGEKDLGLNIGGEEGHVEEEEEDKL
nr:hypothetical protein [Tanacetum cinerariifolium]